MKLKLTKSNRHIEKILNEKPPVNERTCNFIREKQYRNVWQMIIKQRLIYQYNHFKQRKLRTQNKE